MCRAIFPVRMLFTAEVAAQCHEVRTTTNDLGVAPGQHGVASCPCVGQEERQSRNDWLKALVRRELTNATELRQVAVDVRELALIVMPGHEEGRTRLLLRRGKEHRLMTEHVAVVTEDLLLAGTSGGVQLGPVEIIGVGR